jgi:hypothetical protein
MNPEKVTTPFWIAKGNGKVQVEYDTWTPFKLTRRPLGVASPVMLTLPAFRHGANPPKTCAWTGSSTTSSSDAKNRSGREGWIAAMPAPALNARSRVL